MLGNYQLYPLREISVGLRQNDGGANNIRKFKLIEFSETYKVYTERRF